jgi:hypothetical protein
MGAPGGEHTPEKMLAEAERQLQRAHEGLPAASRMTHDQQVRVRIALVGVVEAVRDIQTRLRLAARSEGISDSRTARR